MKNLLRFLAFALMLGGAIAQIEFQESQYLKDLKVSYKKSRDQGDLVTAIKVANEALAISEKEFSSNRVSEHRPFLLSNTALINYDLANFYRDFGQYKKAVFGYVRAFEIYEKVTKEVFPSKSNERDNLFSNMLNDAAVLNEMMGDYPEAEKYYLRYLSIKEKFYGPDSEQLFFPLRNIGRVYLRQKQFKKAEVYLKRSLVLTEKIFGSNHLNTANIKRDISNYYNEIGQYEVAEIYINQSIKTLEILTGLESTEVANSLNIQGTILRNKRQLNEAEVIYKKSIDIYDKQKNLEKNILNKNSALKNFAIVLSNLGGLYIEVLDFEKAKRLFERSYEIKKTILGPEHVELISTLNSLAIVNRHLGEYSKSKDLYLKALKLASENYGENHLDYARLSGSFASLCVVFKCEINPSQILIKSIQTTQKILGNNHPETQKSMLSLANWYLTLANTLFKFGDHISKESKNEAIEKYLRPAESLHKVVLDIRKNIYGLDSIEVMDSFYAISTINMIRGQDSVAIENSRRATEILKNKIMFYQGEDKINPKIIELKNSLYKHLSLLQKNPNNESAIKIVNESLQVYQMIKYSGTSVAIQKMAVRFSTGKELISNLVRRNQDVKNKLLKLEDDFLKQLSLQPDLRSSDFEAKLSLEIQSAKEEFIRNSVDIKNNFPEYEELTRSAPISLADIQKLLKNNEVMLVYELENENDGYLWVIKKNEASFNRLEINLSEISKKVLEARKQMEFENGNKLTPVNVKNLHDLFTSLFEPVVPQINEFSNLIIVPSGVLHSIPISMLVTTIPPSGSGSLDYRNVDWLIKKYVISVLPSVNSIISLRGFSKRSSSKEKFAGFGDPLIGGDSDKNKDKKSSLLISKIFNSRNISTANGRVELADVESIRNAPRLPETADELRLMAKSLNDKGKSIWLTNNATETNVKTIDLSVYKVLAFATHGVMAGEVKGIGEPGLILTPPKEATSQDDGYLSASEVAQLKLNAELVILSACNTAASDGKVGSEGLTGLAKSFFYAGARSLFVSHWPVASETTVQLTTDMLKEYAQNPNSGLAAAHRKSILKLMSKPSNIEYSHPLFWSPFQIIGEGF